MATNKTQTKRTTKATSKKAKLTLKQRVLAFFGEKAMFIISMVILVLSVILLLSIISFFVNGHADQAAVAAGQVNNAQNWCGEVGAYVSDYFVNKKFGYASIFIPLFMMLVSMRLLGAYHVRLWKWFVNLSILMVWGSAALSYMQAHVLPLSVLNSLPGEHIGGNHGDYVLKYLDMVGVVPGGIILVVIALIYLTYVTGETITWVRKLFRPQDFIPAKKRNEEEDSEDVEEMQIADEEELPEEEPQEEQEPEEEEPEGITINFADIKNVPLTVEAPQEGEGEMEVETPADDFTVTTFAEPEEADGKTLASMEDMEPYDPRKDLEHYKFPTLSLLENYGSSQVGVDMEEQQANKKRIIEVLENFGVKITSIKATVGPTITLYEITPAPGVRISKIRTLEDDIALSLSALGIRIIAPIPGKGTIGIEVPNQKPQIVSMESILNSKKFQESTYELPIALGKTITNEVFMVDLAKLPHLLVAGATGQGKSVGLNAIIGSLLYKKHPAELKFVMVDPKKVEFSIYAPLEKHFLAAIPDQEEPVITDVHKVVQTLKSLCQEMDTRYDLLKEAKCKNVKEYNAKFKARQLNPRNGHRFMPYIVVIIDEFGDLIMTAGKEVELPIARIAQLARAVGIHMVIATQRPTTTIITGNIKANFPGRMAFRVGAMIDSRTILDRPGANNLIGRGDMLFLSGNEPVRVQCAFLDTPEVERISEFISKQQGYCEPYQLPEPLSDDDSGVGGMPSDEKLDDMFADVARWVVASQQGSTSAIQRKFSIGYNRAGRITDQLEKMGVVSAARGSKPREVLIKDDQSLQTMLELLQNQF